MHTNLKIIQITLNKHPKGAAGLQARNTSVRETGRRIVSFKVRSRQTNKLCKELFLICRHQYFLLLERLLTFQSVTPSLPSSFSRNSHCQKEWDISLRSVDTRPAVGTQDTGDLASVEPATDLVDLSSAILPRDGHRLRHKNYPGRE